MTQTQHDLTKLNEECCEVGQRCTKAIRFGMAEVQQGQDLHNAARIRLEMAGLMAAYKVLVDSCQILHWPSTEEIEAARLKQEKYRAYSESLGVIKC